MVTIIWALLLNTEIGCQKQTGYGASRHRTVCEESGVAVEQ